jgi:DNA modification methylase
VRGGYQLSIFDGEKSIIVRVPSYEVLSAVDNNLRETIWRCPKPLTNDEHPTMKPVALVAKALNNSSGNGDVVLDLFGGSGSTLIACEQNARICCTMEMDRKYCDVIVKRWESFTGKKAERA